VNLGYPKEECDEAVSLWGFAMTIVFCSHHFICGAALLPVLSWGWADAGFAGQLAFISGLLLDASIDVFDEWQMSMRLFFPKAFEWLGPKQSAKFFVMVGVLHHPLALCMGVPMTLYYSWLPAFQENVVALLFAASICYMTGAYKFTLDTKTRTGFLQYKAIVLTQTVTIYFSRGYIWFTRCYTVFMTFYTEGATGFLIGGCICGVLFSLFNMVLIADATMAAMKWLPRSMPKVKAECENPVASGACGKEGLVSEGKEAARARARTDEAQFSGETSAIFER